MLIVSLAFIALAIATPAGAATAKVGAYYFEGWYHDAPGLIAAFANAELRNDFPEREPIWGGGLWRGDTVEIMEQQIDLAADHGIAFFSFDWYWNGSEAATVNDGINSGLANFMLASNRDRMEFNINIVDVDPTPISSDTEWQQVADLLMPYLADSQYLRVGGDPMVTNFNAAGMTQTNYNYFQQAAAAAGIGPVKFAANVAGASSLYSHVTRYNAVPGWGAGETEFPYQSLTEYVEGNDTWAPGIWNTESGTGQAYIPTIMAGWDARPWNTPPSWYFNPTRTPASVAAHLQKAIDWIDANPTLATPERLVMLYAWNEFGEGGYIAPTVGDPDGLFLDAIRGVINPTTGRPCTGPGCALIDQFGSGSFSLTADSPWVRAVDAVNETLLPSGPGIESRVTEVRLESGNEVRATTSPGAPLTVTIEQGSLGSATVTYTGSAVSDLTGAGRSHFEITIDEAPTAGLLFAFAENAQAWDYTQLSITGPGIYQISFSALDALGGGIDFSSLAAVGFGIRAQAFGTARTFRMSDIRTVIGGSSATAAPEPASWMMLLLGALASWVMRRRPGRRSALTASSRRR
ncbi:MAG: hypothetical protein CMJ18_03195 [Phycisphaeraceae bacterium]|nr:hypothetical protein [Phycisphaeraceae bacterium]